MINLLYIGNRLVSNKTNVTTIDTLGNLLIKEGYKVRFSSSKQNKFFRILDMLVSVFKHRKETDYVLIDTYSTLNFYYAFFVSQLCIILKLKYITILHGGDLPKRLRKSPIKSKMIFKNAYKCVSPSHYLLKEFNAMKFDNIELIPNTIEIDKYLYKKRMQFHAKLLWVRSFKEIYNPLMAIRVAKKLMDFGVEVQMCMVGPDGDDSFRSANSEAKNLGVTVKFTGKLSKEEWIKLSAEYDIFINTSNFDNMPVSLIEAMALGLPIVSTNVGGIPLMVKNTFDAILVEANDIDGMTDAILTLLKDKDLANKLSYNGRLNAENFDWNVIRTKWVTLLK